MRSLPSSISKPHFPKLFHCKDFSLSRFSFFVERRDESALLNLFDVGWIDDQVWIGLLCLWILIRKYFQRGLDNLERRDRYHFQTRLRGLIGLFENIVSGAAHVFFQSP